MYKKYLYIAKNSFTNTLSDPGKLFAFVFGHFATALVYLIFWGAVYKIYPNYKGYTFNTIVLYYIGGSLLSRLVSASAGARSIEEQIATGQLSMRLLQPVSWNIRTIISSTTIRVSTSVSGIIILAVITVLFNQEFINVTKITLFSISLFLATILNYYLYAFVGVIAFYTTKIWGFRSIFGRIADLTSGKVFPLDMLGSQMANIFMFLPFNYTYFFIMQIYLNKINYMEVTKGLGIQISWLIITVLFYNLLFSKGMKHYESVGI